MEALFQAESPWTDAAVLSDLAEHPDKSVRLAVASNPTTPPEALARMAVDPRTTRETLDAVAANPNTPPPVLHGIAFATLPIDNEDALYDAAYEAIRNPSLPLEDFAALASDESVEIRGRVAKNPSCPVEILRVLSTDRDTADGNPLARIGCAANLNIPSDILGRLLHDDHNRVRRAAAGNPRVPVPVLEGFASLEYWRSTPGGFVDTFVLEGVANNPQTPRNVLAWLYNHRTECHLGQAGDLSWSVFLGGMSSNPNTPPEILAELATSSDDSIRSDVAANESTPPHVLARLASDPRPFVRRAVYRNPTASSADRETAQMLGLA